MNCHTWCVDYKIYSENLENIRANREKEKLLNSYTINSVERMKRRKGRV